jgi:hypothetical protein
MMLYNVCMDNPSADVFCIPKSFFQFSAEEKFLFERAKKYFSSRQGHTPEIAADRAMWFVWGNAENLVGTDTTEFQVDDLPLIVGGFYGPHKVLFENLHESLVMYAGVSDELAAAVAAWAIMDDEMGWLGLMREASDKTAAIIESLKLGRAAE